jgi:hypothetical protein
MAYLIPNFELYITKNEKSGEFITLSDNSVWHIVNIADRVKTMIWIIRDKIKISQKDKIYLLTNLRNKDTILAKYIEPKK